GGRFVCDFRSFSDRWNWEIPLLVSLRGGALDEFENCLEYLYHIPDELFSEGPPCLVWPLQRSESFSMASLRRELLKNKFQGVEDFPDKEIWRSEIPSKVGCFCWKVLFKKIATIDNLQRRGFELVNRCVLCYSNLESVDHIFLHFNFAAKIWGEISSALSLHGPRPFDVKGLFAAWKGMNCDPTFGRVKGVTLHAFFWFIWKERNGRIFSD
ncbi:hypothetical protein LINPERHAP1_LOCUS7899, partial [Linum perenne]